jgi:ectoine hydroxylase-related dioxygenase (phytanoyl-CoA dioxygenase family)
MTMLSDLQKQQLDSSGWLILNQCYPADFLSNLNNRLAELLAAEGDDAGAEFKQEPQTKRLANLVDKGDIFAQVIAQPEILDCVRQVLGPEFKLSSLNYRSADPYSTWVQPLHCDTGALPDDKGFSVCNVILMLDDFTAENGATRFVPGTHRAGKLPQEVLADPAAPHPDEMLVTGQAGTVIVMNTHLWHGGTANRTARPRRALHSFYCRRDKPQQQYQKKLIRPEVQQTFSAQLRWLLALDDSLNDELSSQMTGMSGFLK